MRFSSKLACTWTVVAFVACKSGGAGEAAGPDASDVDAGHLTGGDASHADGPSGSSGSGGGGGAGDAGGHDAGSGADTFAWAANTKPASKGSLVNAIAADATGVVMVGELEGSIVVNGTTLKANNTAQPGGNAFMIKYDTTGTPKWALVDTAVVSGGFSVFQSVVIDPTSGDILVGANFIEKMTVAGTTITLPTAKLGGEMPNVEGGALLRFKSDGASVVWAETMETTDTITVASLAIDGTGDVTAAGWNNALTSFGTSSGTPIQLNSPTVSPANGDLYFARYTSAGVLKWAVTPASTPAGSALASISAVPPPTVPPIAVDASGNIYLAVGSDVIGASGPQLTGGHAYLNKYTSAGALTWSQEAAGTGGPYFTVTGLTLDPSGDPIVCGTLGSYVDAGVSTSLATFGTFTVTEPGFVAKYSASGAAQWATGISDGSALNEVFCAATASKVYAFAEAALDSPHADVLTLDPSTGTLATTPVAVATGQQVWPQAIVTSGASVFIAGQVRYPAVFGTTTFAGDGKSTVPFVAELAP